MVSKVSGFISDNTAGFSNYSRKSISPSRWLKIFFFFFFFLIFICKKTQLHTIIN